MTGLQYMAEDSPWKRLQLLQKQRIHVYVYQNLYFQLITSASSTMVHGLACNLWLVQLYRPMR